MSDPVLPLGGARHEGRVIVEETGPQGMITLRGYLSDPVFAEAVTQTAGTAMPAQRRVSAAGARALLWMAPDELALMLPRAEAAAAAAQLAARLQGTFALAADVSDARAHFRLAGEDVAVRETLAKLAPVDFAPGAFPVGELRRTRLAQTAAGIWMPGPGEARVFTFRSVARYAFDLLATAAGAGAAVGAFQGTD